MLVVVGVLGQLSLVMQKRIEGKEDYKKASKARCVALSLFHSHVPVGGDSPSSSEMGWDDENMLCRCFHFRKKVLAKGQRQEV